MSSQPNPIDGYDGIDARTDPLILGKNAPQRSVLSYNYRANKGVREVRPGQTSVIDFAGGKYPKKSGIYFPPGAGAVIPLTTSDLVNSFYLASTDITTADLEYAWTIEFWYRVDFLYKNLVVTEIPVWFGSPSAIYEHMKLTFEPQPGSAIDTGSYRVRIKFVTWDPANDTYGGVQQAEHYQPVATKADVMKFAPADGIWHHFLMRRYEEGHADQGKIEVKIDNGTAQLLSYSGTGEDLDPMPDVGYYIRQRRSNGTLPVPWMATHFKIGDTGLSMAEFRVWRDRRTDAEITSTWNVPLLGTESDLLVYCPMNEGDGFRFDEKVNSGYGYMFPQEPFTDENDRLCFSGASCLAIPSKRSWYSVDQASGTPTPAKPAAHEDNNEDAGYDGGILWDIKLNESSVVKYGGTGVPTDWSEYIGIWQGCAQIRFILRQWGEGVICGRLALSYEPGDHTKMRFIISGSDDLGATTYFCSDPIVDETWLNVPHTVTIFYRGQDASALNRIQWYADTTDIWDGIPVFSWGGAGVFTGYPFHIEKTTDDIGGALGGSTYKEKLSLAFDLVFFRQWYDEVPETEYGAGPSWDPTEFVANTYDQEELPEKYRKFLDGISGYVEQQRQSVFVLNGSSEMLNLMGQNQLKYIRLPFYEATEPLQLYYNCYFYITKNGNAEIPKQDIMVKRILEWNIPTGGWIRILGPKANSATEFYELKKARQHGAGANDGWMFFNGAILSNMVNEYNYKTFKENKSIRPLYEDSPAISSLGDGKFLRIFDVFEDDSPIQGIEKFGADEDGSGVYIFKSKYIYLWSKPYIRDAEGTADLLYTVHNQKSRKPRWCDGPILPLSVPAIRGIHRYTSEDGTINKLLVVAWSTVYELDPVAKTLTTLQWGWMNRNADQPVNFILVNNRLVISDSDNAIKMNYEGFMSRLGIERPIDVSVSKIGAEVALPFALDDQYGYVAIFVDSKNNAISGSIPIFKADGQTITLTTASGMIDVAVKTNFDYNVDQVWICRTKDMTNGAGTETDVYVIAILGIAKVYEPFVSYRDVWADDNIETYAKARYVDNDYVGKEVLPVPSKGQAVGFGRLFFFGSEDAKSKLTWCKQDGFALPMPDVFPFKNSMIIEEGETSEGRALQWFGADLIGFKEDSIFRVYQQAPGKFAHEIIFRGAGVLNQRCIQQAANALFFLDQGGLYRYTGGEPEMVSERMTEFLVTCNLTDATKPFLLFNPDDFSLLVFVPGPGSTYCDTAIVYNLRKDNYTIDVIPDVTCGYVDEKTIYLGTPYGHVLKYDPTVTYDVVSISGTGGVS